ncbi:MAG: sigma-54-dependent Fis family transcriptional regulator [Deltaproteobacteria bacterium]|nr:sigma-54-dependent Fis family transcriptional regulator [Deltaproteobacteria bacterium]
MSRILIADDDDNLRYSFRRMLEGKGFSFIEASDGREAIAQAKQERPDVIVMDVRMPVLSGLEAFEEIKRALPEVPVIIMTAYGTTETAIEAMKRGAFDYIVKPFEVEEMRALISRALERGQDEAQGLDLGRPAQEPHPRPGLIGSSRAMQRVYKAVGHVAGSDVAVLLLGETGTGKELVARTIHEHSPRQGGPFLAINCAAIPETLIEGELFGHERGAYTGAEQRKIGLLQSAAGGTVLLDEISEMPPSAQAKLLRFLQEGEILMLGGERPVHVDTRVIAASNRELGAEVARGQFRDDLFYRLNVVSIIVPPLRERLDDLEALVAHFVCRFGAEHGKSFARVSGRAIALLKARRWPGNVRELMHVTRRAVIVGHGPVLLPAHFFPETLDDLGDGTAQPDLEVPSGAEQLLRQLVDLLRARPGVRLLPTLERLAIDYVYQQAGGNQVQAARPLGITRNTLRSRLEKYDIGLRPAEEPPRDPIPRPAGRASSAAAGPGVVVLTPHVLPQTELARPSAGVSRDDRQSHRRHTDDRWTARARRPGSRGVREGGCRLR